MALSDVPISITVPCPWPITATSCVDGRRVSTVNGSKNVEAATAFVRLEVEAAEEHKSDEAEAKLLVMWSDAVAVVKEEWQDMDRHATARATLKRKQLEKGKQHVAMWRNFSAVFGGAGGVKEISLTMRNEAPEQQSIRVMAFLAYCLDEVRMNGKELQACITALVLFFDVYAPQVVAAFKDKMVKAVLKVENKLTHEQQADQARTRLYAETQPIVPAHLDSLADKYYKPADERTEVGIRVMAVYIGTYSIVNWGFRIGHVCGPLTADLRDHSTLVGDVFFYFASDDGKQIERMCATERVETMDRYSREGWSVVDFELLLPTNKSTDALSTTVAAARLYRVVGAGGSPSDAQKTMLVMNIRYWRAAQFNSDPTARYFEPRLADGSLVRLPSRKAVNNLIKEAAVGAGLAVNMRDAAAFTSKSGRNAAASIIQRNDGSDTQEWARNSNVPAAHYRRKPAALGTLAVPQAEVAGMILTVASVRASARQAARARSSKA